jgi:hypothetical protein
MMDRYPTNVAALVGSSLARPLASDIQAMANHVREKHETVAAILAYGSCLRGVSADDTLIDLYVLVEDEAHVSPNKWSRLAARLLPPNVYYSEMSYCGRTLRCKYATMTLQSFARCMRPQAKNPYFWARFSQPASLAFAADERSREHVVNAITDAVTTMFRTALSTAPLASDPLEIWRLGFEETYDTELRPEAQSRAREIVATNQAFYREAARQIGAEGGLPVFWPWRRLVGKFLSLARLVKAGLTFEGGAAYAAWKIERHSGKKVTLTPWQKQHPVLAGLLLLPRLLWLGAIR